MLILTDLHLNTFQQWSIMEDGMNSRLLDQIRVISKIANIIESNRVENVFFLGDMIDSFSDSLPKVVYNAIWYAIHSWSRTANLYILVGNHDIWRGHHLFDPYREMENVHIIAGPEMGWNIEDHYIDLIPWGFDLPEPKSRGDILMSHMEVRGATMNAAGTRTTAGVDCISLKGYKYAFLGHYHEAQILPVPDSIWAGYIGSIMQQDLSLSPGDKGVTFLNKDGVVRVEIPSPKIYTARVERQEDMDSLVGPIKEGNYWRLTILDPAIKLPPFDHRVQVEYDIKPRVEARLEEKEGEDLCETVVRFIDTVDTKVDKELAKILVGEVMR